MNHPIDFFYEHAGMVLKPYMKVEPAGALDICAVCERPSLEWASPTEKVVFHNYGTEENHCLSCHSLYEGSIDLFGVERMAKGTPVPMKLGMATGCGALVSREGVTLFLNGFIKKMSLAKKPPFKMLELSGRSAHLAIIDHHPENQPFLYIGNFGRKKRDLVSNLIMSNANVLMVCEESGTLQIPMRTMRTLTNTSKALKPTEKNAIKSLLRQQITGTLTRTEEEISSELSSFSEKHPDVWESIKTLPIDPHQRLNILQLW